MSSTFSFEQRRQRRLMRMPYKKKEVEDTEDKVETKSTPSNVEVELDATMTNELVGKHVAHTSYGTFVFNDGVATVSSEFVERLRRDLVIK